MDTEYDQRKIRGRGVGRKPHDVVVKFAQGAVWLQPSGEGGYRIDLLVQYSQVLGVTDWRLQEELERQGCVHLCQHSECTHLAAPR